MVRVETISKVISVVGLFEEATPYDIHSITLMNYDSIRTTLKAAKEGKLITKAGENTVKLTEFGHSWMDNFGVPKQIQKTFDGANSKKHDRLKKQIGFLDDGSDNKGSSKGNKRSPKSK